MIHPPLFINTTLTLSFPFFNVERNEDYQFELYFYFKAYKFIFYRIGDNLDGGMKELFDHLSNKEKTPGSNFEI